LIGVTDCFIENDETEADLDFALLQPSVFENEQPQESQRVVDRSISMHFKNRKIAGLRSSVVNEEDEEENNDIFLPAP
jgi:hypothetical protein